MPQYPSTIVQQLMPAFLSRTDIIAWMSSLSDDFMGAAIDARWTVVAGAGGTAPSLAVDSPTRIVGLTGTTCITDTQLTESGFKWNVSDKFTVVVRARSDSSAPQHFYPIRLRASDNNEIVLGFNSSVDTASYILRTVSGSTASNNVLPIERDDQWHDFFLSVHGTDRVRARIDCDPTPFAENASRIPTVDLRFFSGLNNRTTAETRQISIDSVLFVPRLVAF